MAATAVSNVNRGTSNVLLEPEVSSEIWARTLEESAFMSLARRVSLPGSGKEFQTITGEPAADWVAETEAKPVGSHTFGKKTMTPYKLSVIEPFSDEFVRDKEALYNECLRRLPFALAKKFDSTIMGTSAPGSNFDVLGGCTAVSILPSTAGGVTTGTYEKFLAVDAAITAADGIMNGIALAPQGKSIVMGQLDSTGRPLFTPGVGSNTVGDILGAPVHVRKAVYKAGAAATGTAGQEGYVAAVPAVVGIAGDWTDALYGTVEGIKMSVSSEASLTTTDGTLNLWQSNMVAVRFEVEVGFIVKSTSEFVLLTGNTPSA